MRMGLQSRYLLEETPCFLERTSDKLYPSYRVELENELLKPALKAARSGATSNN